MANIYELEAMNLFAEDEDPSKSQFLVLEEVKLPMFQEKTKEHTGGGAIGAIKIGLRTFEAIEVTFKLRGFNPDVINKFMSAPNGRRKYTGLGNVRDIQSAREFQVKMVAEGRMTKVDMGSFQRDGGVSTDYQIDEIVHYEFYLDGIEKYYWNYFDGPLGWRVDGVAALGGMARNLGLA